MSTTLLNSLTAICKDLNDNFTGTTTGAGSATTMVDSTLTGKQNDFIPRNGAWVILLEEPAGDAAIYDERLVTALDNSTGTLTTVTFAAAPGTGIDYRLTRLFSPSDYRTALIHAAKDAYPVLSTKIRNEAKRAGNWLKDGSFEYWTSSSALGYWTASSSTLTQTSTAKLFIHGSYSCKLSGDAGYVGQSITNNDDLKLLRGKSVTLRGRGHSDTASSLRMAIYDGTTLTYSDYHPGNSAWDDDTDSWYVTADISATATEVSIRAYHDQAAAIEYIDDFRLTSDNYDRVYIGDLSIAQDSPIKVSYSHNLRTQSWVPVQAEAGGDGYIYLDAPVDAYLRIEGTGYLDYLVSGSSSTAWTAAIAVDEPQLQILTAQAALYLYQQMSLPNMVSGNNEAYIQGYNFWTQELKKRKYKFGMERPNARSVWTV